MAGRKPKYDEEVVLDILDNNLSEFIVDGVMIGPTVKIWNEIIEKENIVITTRGLYTLVKKNLKRFLNGSSPDVDKETSNVTVGEISKQDPSSSSWSESEVIQETKFKVSMNYEK